MSQLFSDIYNGIKDLIARNPVAGYLTLALFIGVTIVALNYLFQRLKSNYLKLLAPLGQTLPLPVLILLKDQILANLGNDVSVVIIIVFILYVILTHFIYNNLFQIETGKSKTGQMLIIFLGFLGIVTWIYLIATMFYDFNVSSPLPTTPPPPEGRQ